MCVGITANLRAHMLQIIVERMGEGGADLVK